MTPEQINNFFSFLYQGRWGFVTFWVRLVAGILISALAAAIVIISIKFRQLIAPASAASPRPETVPVAETIAGPWQEVMQKIDSPNPSDWHLAVIRADAIMDDVLKGMGLAGETMGERLRQLNLSSFQSLNDVWEAHKLRNRIVHDSDRVLTYQEARRAVMLFGRALGELGYIQE